MKKLSKEELLEKKIEIMSDQIEIMKLMNYMVLDYIKLEQPDINDKIKVVNKLDRCCETLKRAIELVEGYDTLLKLNEIENRY